MTSIAPILGVHDVIQATGSPTTHPPLHSSSGVSLCNVLLFKHPLRKAFLPFCSIQLLPEVESLNW